MFASNSNNFFSKSEGDLFADSKQIQHSIESSQYVEYRPLSSNTDNVIDFSINGGPEFIDLALTKVRVKVTIRDENDKIVKNKWKMDKDSNSIPDGRHVVPISNFMCSLFDGVNISLNNKNVTSSGSCNHAYRSYIEKVFNYTGGSKRTHLTPAMYIEDQTGEFNSTTSVAALERMERISPNTGIISMEGYIHTDFSNSSKLLINKIPVTFKLTRNKAKFSLVVGAPVAAGEDYKIKIEEIVLLVRKVKLTEDAMNANEAFLKAKNVVYSFDRNEIRQFTLAAGLSQYTIDNAIIGQQAKRLLIMLMASSDEENFTSSPYRFQPFGLKLLQISGDNFQNLSPVRLDISNKDYQEGYMGLHEALNIYYHDSNVGITPDKYLSDCFAIAKDLTPDWCATGPHSSLPVSGSMRIALQFDEPLTKTVKMLVYSEFDSYVTIDSARVVSTDYAC